MKQDDMRRPPAPFKQRGPRNENRGPSVKRGKLPSRGGGGGSASLWLLSIDPSLGGLELFLVQARSHLFLHAELAVAPLVS